MNDPFIPGQVAAHYALSRKLPAARMICLSWMERKGIMLDHCNECCITHRLRNCTFVFGPRPSRQRAPLQIRENSSSIYWNLEANVSSDHIGSKRLEIELEESYRTMSKSLTKKWNVISFWFKEKHLAVNIVRLKPDRTGAACVVTRELQNSRRGGKFFLSGCVTIGWLYDFRRIPATVSSRSGTRFVSFRLFWFGAVQQKNNPFPQFTGRWHCTSAGGFALFFYILSGKKCCGHSARCSSDA